MWNASRFCVSSLRRGHANLLCIVPILVYVPPKRVRGRTLPPAVYIPAAVGLLPPAAKAASVNVRRGGDVCLCVRATLSKAKARVPLAHRTQTPLLLPGLVPPSGLGKGPARAPHGTPAIPSGRRRNQKHNDQLIIRPRAKATDRSCQDSNLESSDP